MHALSLAGEHVILLCQRAIHWPARRTLFIADLHLGKAAAFGSHGLPLTRQVIDGVTERDLQRLSALLAHTAAERLVILGDMIHARRSHEPGTLERFAAWRAGHAQLSIELIRGNHDRSAGDPPPDWRITCHGAGVIEGPFALHHEPQDDPAGYALCGHLHPGVSIFGASAESQRAPCFLVGPRRAVLPAFGTFTGNARGVAADDDELFAVGPENIVPIPRVRRSPPRFTARAGRRSRVG